MVSPTGGWFRSIGSVGKVLSGGKPFLLKVTFHDGICTPGACCCLSGCPLPSQIQPLCDGQWMLAAVDALQHLWSI